MSSSAAVNHWPDTTCARAFWGQRELPPYRHLLADTVAWFDPRPGERWIDLGCGSGQLTRSLWEKSRGTVAQVLALDVAAANERAIHRLRDQLQPRPTDDQMRFLHANFSAGLAACPAASFDGAVSGLAIQYAESWCPERGCWTTDAYDHLLAEVRRILRPGGRFVFSVNVPEPAWGRVAVHAVHGVFRTSHPLRYLKNALRMMRYGSWLKHEARRGRFHYLPVDEVKERLARAGFSAIEHRVSFAGQAYVLRCRRPLEPDRR